MAKKADENLKDKIKSLFRLNKDKGSPVQYQRASLKDFVFTADILKDIGPESPHNNRIKTIKELSEVVQKKRLEENAVEAVWCSIQDLVLPQALSEKRHVALQFLLCLLEGQLNNLGILRGHFFHVLQGLTLPENTSERLALFKVLSENGRNLLEFEEEAGPALLDWMPSVVAQGKAADFLPLLISAIKYNAAYMDEEIISGFVKQTCLICNQRSENEVKLCIEVLDVVVCYSYLPSDCLQDFVEALCRLVNIPKYCEASWEVFLRCFFLFEKLMRKLLGTHLGHSSIYTMCVMLQNRREVLDYRALRGAIFFIGMALWGSRKVPLLKHTPAAVLPSFLHVLSSENAMLAYEVILSVQRLVKKYGKELNQSTWDVVLDIVEKVLKQLEAVQMVSTDPRALAELHDTLSAIESLHETGHFLGSVVRFFKIVEMCAANRPEGSVILLISHQAQSIHPGKEHWINNLFQLMDKYFRTDTRTKVRLKALDVLAFVLSINKHMYEDELINSVVLPQLCHIDTDSDVSVRKAAVEILLVLAQNCSQNCFMDVISIVEKVMGKPMVGKQMSPYPSADGTEIVRTTDESQLADIKTAVVMLVELFKTKLYAHPPGVFIKLFDHLTTHLSAHYSVPRDYCSQTASAVRKCIVQCLLNLRADYFHRVGIYDRCIEGPMKCSPFITCKRDEIQTSPPHSPVSSAPCSGQWSNLSYLDYTRVFDLFIEALENERDWNVLGTVLENLPLLLQNKTIVLSARRCLIDLLSSKLCAMVNDRQLGFPEKLRGTPVKFTRSDFHSCIFPVLSAIVTFHDYLDRTRQKELIKCLEFGMVSSCAKLCVNALRICTLEMHEVMMRLLPSVLLQLSKISATNSMAIPVLAFLSSIVRCPKMYANFVEDEYMSVFAIALPYTNPFKFSHYTVSLAHHVIAIWFIRCRLPFRKGFVQFIQKGLKANVLQQFEENAKLALQNQNEDSSDRARSGSYSEAALRSRRRMQSGSAISRSDIHAPVDEKRSQFHRELTETCTDVMARYTFGNFSPLPHRSNMAEFLLAGGQTQTWLVGNKLITITTSGGGNKLGNSGVCEKCQAVYQSSEIKEQKPSSQSVRRRHRSEITVSRSSSSIETKQLSSQDDLTIQSKSSLDDMNLEELAAQDASVQTGSSLTDPPLIENEPLESFILGLKGSDSRRPAINLCNCWCTNWAEIYIRAPSGNLSWMMRIENEAGLYSVQDSQLPDFSMLLASMGQKKPPKHERQNRRIESGSIGEEEYESLYAQHFPGAQTDSSIAQYPMDGKIIEEDGVKHEGKGEESQKSSVVQEASETVNTHQVSEALQIPTKDSAGNHDLSPGSMRRSNSSPSIMSGSSDTLSPRDSISDIVQFGPKPDKPSSGKALSETKPSPVEKRYQGQDQFEFTEPKPDLASRQDSTEVALKQNDTAVKKEKDESECTAKNPDLNIPTSIDHAVAVPKPNTSLLSKQLSPSPVSSETSSSQDEVGELPSNLRRRGHTVASTPAKSTVSVSDSFLKGGGAKELTRVGISPSFVFLQLYHSGQLHTSATPYLLQNNETVERAIKMLDHIYPYETHKIGVIYVGPGQTKDEKAILSNEYGSERYMNFVQTLGNLLRLKDCDPQRIYLGGLGTDGKDGEFTYNWQDESIQMVFHIATLMPKRESDKNCNAKKLHIGNDNVTVVYNDSGEDYSIGVIKGQVNYVDIVIKPLDYESNAVTLQAKEDIAEILGHKDTKIISDLNLATLIRQIAIHCNLASMVLQRQQSMPQDPFANNWLERLRRIRRMKSMIDSTSQDEAHTSFTEYV